MYCEKCGTEMDEKAAFCPGCGNALRKRKNPNLMGVEIHSNTDKKLQGKIGNWIFLPLLTIAAGFICAAIGLLTLADLQDGSIQVNHTSLNSFSEKEVSGRDLIDLLTLCGTLVICGIIAAIIGFRFVKPIIPNCILSTKPVFADSYLRLKDGKVQGCGSAVSCKPDMQSFELDPADIDAIQCNRTALYIALTKKSKHQIPVDEIVIVAKDKTYRIWGILNAAELVNNFNNILR